jgi:hypothetical protein
LKNSTGSSPHLIGQCIFRIYKSYFSKKIHPITYHARCPLVQKFQDPTFSDLKTSGLNMRTLLIPWAPVGAATARNQIQLGKFPSASKSPELISRIGARIYLD